GSPGSRVWHSSDGGHIWMAESTGQTLPIRALEFVDDEHGWAVGSFGLILATADGGRTWQRQHTGGARTALLGLFADAAAVPLELLAKLSAQEGYLSAVEILTRADLEPGAGGDTLADCRAIEALALAGAGDVETAWAFPVRQPGLNIGAQQLVAGWDRAGEGAGVARFEAHLVRQIRTWRPDVIVTHAASPQGENPLGHAINQLVLRAVEQAADPTRETDQAARLGLEPWRVQKVLGYLPAGRSGVLNLAAAQLAPSLGCSLSEAADRARAVLGSEPGSGPANLAFQLLVDHVPQGAGTHDFFSGIVLQPGGDARRGSSQDSDRPDEVLRRSGPRLRNWQAILGSMERKSFNHDRLLAEMGQLISELEPDQAAELLYQMAHQYQRRGRWDLALDIADLLVTRYPDHPMTEPVLVWLTQCWASSEVGWRTDPGSRAPVRPLAAPIALPAPAAALPASASALPADAAATRRERAVAAARLLERRFPAAYTDPVIQFPLAAALRPAQLSQAEKLYRNFASGRPHDAWWSCAASRLWLREPQDECPKPIWRVAAAGSRPKLDGRLEEPIWQTATAIELHSALGDDRDWPARTLAAVDGEFLYLAVECREAPGCRYDAAAGPRPRDPDLADRDRIEIYLDLDCDWVTYFRLVIDHRGWAAEDCWHDASWNPQWFVAADRQSGGWTIEAALPLEALARQRPRAGDVWAVGVQRIVPQVGFQSFSTPAAITPIGEGFGLLIFD
ncbi:MAG TPA: hypothetical protein VHY20_04530, partial [Pirellulales bacterium]|nr:hypothetical protein [Pirellulales bacterium]